MFSTPSALEYWPDLNAVTHIPPQKGSWARLTIVGSSSGPSTATWPRLRLPKIADELHVVPPSFELQATTVWLDAPSGLTPMVG
ncbi:MAG: hypothetical protein U0S48_05225 [Solirubrobacteraceae bacterium]